MGTSSRPSAQFNQRDRLSEADLNWESIVSGKNADSDEMDSGGRKRDGWVGCFFTSIYMYISAGERNGMEHLILKSEA